MRRYRSAWLAATSLFLFADVARAEPAASGAASSASASDSAPSAAPSTSRRVLALVVTSNKSSRLARPDLHYADDDGAKYREMFRMFAPDDAVTLLTTFDRDSERLFPDLPAKIAKPERARVFAEAARLGRMAAEATARGEKVDFYFVFAGHGDVEHGRGYLELADGALYADDLEKLLKSVPATRSHVLIDSCNSFFVLAARKPGGRRFATAVEAATSLNQRLPNVGVFLSTSAEAETFEWSEVGGGIFSHIVRSGLSGAADVNRDGEVSYDELAAFAHTASADIKNPRFRPQVFARGPSGAGQTAMLHMRDAVGTRLRLPRGSGRVTVRDQDEMPWIDAHAEGETEAAVVMPPRFASVGVVDTYRDGVASRRLMKDNVDDRVALGGAPLAMDARGPGDVFRALFARPFGPRAFAQYATEAEQAAPAVFGVADDDTRRMDELLSHAAENARGQRHLQVLAGTTGALFIGAVAAEGLLDPHRTGAWPSLIPTGILAGASLYRLIRPSREERTLAWFRTRQRSAGASAQLTYEAETRLFEMAEADERERVIWRWMGIGHGALLVGLYGSFVADDIARGVKAERLLLPGAFVLATAVGFSLPIIGTFSPTYTERTAQIWANDPSRERARLDGALKAPSFTLRAQVGAGSVGLGGTF